MACTTQCIDLTANGNHGKPIVYWLEDLQLHDEDRQCLSDGNWLTDSVIDAALALLKKAYPYIGGLEPVSLGQTLAFTIQKEEFVQVLNVSGNHWITTSSIGCKPGNVNVFDSIHA